MSDALPPDNDKFHQDTNEVQDFFTRIKLGWIRYGNLITGVLLAASIAWFGWNLWQRRKNDHREADASAFLSDSPAVLVGGAATAHDPKTAALLALRGADLFLKKSQTEAKEDEAKKALASAEAAYQQVLANAAADPIVKANAQLGMAQVAESKNDWAGAEAAYDAVLKGPDVLPSLADIAKRRKELLASLKTPVVYGPEPVKIETAAPAPAAPAAPAK